MDRSIAAARETGCDAIHPGYGFLSENPDFAAACQDAGVTFVGPGAASIRRMGLKTEARQVARSAGVPVVPGSDAPVDSIEDARRAARDIGYPVMLKAAAGGGGKGMRRVQSEAELEAALRDASSEAERSFNSGAVYIEKLILQPRHIEIQVLGDHHGHIVHLGERECSIQRRHQKVIEECPSPFVVQHPELRQAMGEAAIRVARAAGYTNAGTVEFLVDAGGSFHFLEMNTRLQVEHPVTELVTGVDLVHWQFRIAAGEPLTLRQSSVRWHGAAIECRVCAEDPDHNFLPCPGRITAIAAPHGPGIRLDSGVYPGWTVPIEYDPLLAKLVAWAPDRASATRRLLAALDEYSISGIRTNLPFFRGVLSDPQFQQGRLHTAFIEEYFRRAAPASPPPPLADMAVLAAVAHSRGQPAPRPALPPASRWLIDGRKDLLR